MSDKKNIDRLFQEKFKDFEVAPDAKVWQNIEAALKEEEEERRIIPFWFKFGGIAASLILGFFALNTIFNNSIPVDKNPVVIENTGKSGDKNTLENASENNESIKSSRIPKENKIANGKDANNSQDNTIVNSTQSVNQKADGQSNLSKAKNNAVASESGIKKENTPGNKKLIQNLNPDSNRNNTIANGSKTIQKRNASGNKKAIQNLNSGSNQDNAIASKSGAIKNNNPVSKSEQDNLVAFQKKNNPNDKNVLKNNNDGIVKKENTDTNIANNNKTNTGKNLINKTNIPVDNNTTDKKDSTAIAKVDEPNALEELLKKNEEEKNTIAEAKMNRWQITSNVAPIYFSSTSNGSPIDEQFAQNSKSYENNVSFGVGVNYAVNKKLSVRTGVNKFTLGYNTNDVVFFASLDQPSFANVASSSSGSTIQVISQNNTDALKPFDSDIQNTNNGIMTQKMGYFEVPVEMSYKLIDKKFGINVIGGLSTLFLNENEVSVSSSTMSASLGKAKNLNDIHFSTNVGLGFKYRFWKSFEANFEPMFKYQINTFNKDAGNFKPYFIGLYSGVSFNF